MKDTIKYSPFQNEALFIPIPIIFQVLAFVIIGHRLPNFDFGSCFFLVNAVLSFWAAKRVYDASNIAVFFEPDGLRITGGSHKNYRYFPWNQFAYAYYTRNFKGHLFLVLSPRVLSKKQVKQYVNHSSIASKLCIDSVIVICFDFLQDLSQIEALVDSKFPRIEAN